MSQHARHDADIDTDPDLPDDLDVSTLPRLSFEQMISPGWDCIDLERGIYESPLGDYYRSPYRRPDGE